MHYPKNKKYSRIEKLYHLLEKNPQGLSITEIANEFEVSTKTIQRDLYENLIAMGAYKEGKYWKLSNHRRQSTLEVEQNNILAIFKGFGKNMGESFKLKSNSLLYKLSPNIPTHIHTHLDTQNFNQSMLEKLKTLEKHITNHTQISFSYKSKYYCLKPLKVAYFDGYWYLLGLDSNSEDKFKKFILSEISYLLGSDESFEVDFDIDEKLKNAHNIWFELNNAQKARLKLSPYFKEYFYRKPLKTQKILGEIEDGGLEIEIDYTHDMELCEIFIHHFPHISILSPSSLQSSILRELKEEYQSLLA